MSRIIAKFISLIITVSFVSITEYAYSCTCARRSSTIPEFIKDYNSYDLIFIGSTKSIITDEKAGNKIIVFRIITALKTPKNLKQSVEVRTPINSGFCGLDVTLEEKWIVFAYKKSHQQGFYTSLCTSTAKYVNNNLKQREADELHFIEELISKRDGYYKFRFKEGIIGAEGYYRSKLPDGVWRYYRGDGSPFQVLYFNQGALDSLRLYYSKRGENYYEDRKYEHGISFTHKIYNLSREYIKFYHENGQLKEEGKYRNRQKVGKWKKYNKTGKLIKETEY